jgi:hypothetical protein
MLKKIAQADATYKVMSDWSMSLIGDWKEVRVWDCRFQDFGWLPR